jgi:hypothetical protein
MLTLTCIAHIEHMLNFDMLRLLTHYRVRVLNATLNNISVISLRSVLLMEETVVSGENNRPADSH